MCLGAQILRVKAGDQEARVQVAGYRRLRHLAWALPDLYGLGTETRLLHAGNALRASEYEGQLSWSGTQPIATEIACSTLECLPVNAVCGAPPRGAYGRATGGARR